MIKKITIRDVASYDSEGVVLDDLQKVNFIYGGNGTGKTTISRVLEEAGNNSHEPWGENASKPNARYKNCAVEWENGKPMNVVVYNKDFKERNLKESMPGVFMLGEEWIGTEKQIEDMQPQLDMAADKVRVARNKLTIAEGELANTKAEMENKMWNEVHEKYKYFKNCMKGCNVKPAFVTRLKDEVRKWGDDKKKKSLQESIWPLSDIEEMKRRYKELYEGKYKDIGKENPYSDRVIWERELLTDELWRHMSLEAYDMVKGLERRITKLERKVEALDDEHEMALYAHSQFRTTITNTLDMVSSVKPSMENINQKLKSMGFTGFSIQPSPLKDNYYQIQREDGTFVEDTLSEGETSFITFLYFMEKLRDTGMKDYLDAADVVVIDDPISSMDRDVMYTVSEMVHQLLDDVRSKDYNGEVKQVFVLTHNVAFHQAVSDRQRRRNTCYWTLEKDDNMSIVTAYGEENPVRSDYAELWGRLKEANVNKNSIVMPNLMRRIIETYFVWNGGYEKRKLLAGGYAKNHEDEIVIAGLSKWFDEESHGIRGDVYSGSGQASSKRCMEALRMFFVKMGQGEHYNMMMAEHHHE